ncbi:MAG: FeoB-associated Cys-rich membrane protein [Desulfovibrio sp.]|jgi:hypothetical protein
MSLDTLAVVLIVAVSAWVVIRRMVRQFRNRGEGCGCSGDCGGCSGNGAGLAPYDPARDAAEESNTRARGGDCPCCSSEPKK